ncbi:MAG: DNA-directed RNA polymerase subunit omega [Candidatus Korarchaeota archaeon]|nr:DNA-directed RNA polymerase subunit omega [Candidatus Korarchaeota archaeon]
MTDKGDLLGPKKLTRYERTRIIAFRAQQIAAGSPLFLKDDEIPEGVTDPVELAELELKLGRIPVKLVRRVLDREIIVDLNDLLG